MQPNDAEANTVGDYLCNLLLTVWTRGKYFSGKRSFTTPDWKYDLYAPLVAGNFIEGGFNDCGEVILYCSEDEVDYLIRQCIKYVFRKYLEVE